MNTFRLGALAAIVAVAAFLWFHFQTDPQPATDSAAPSGSAAANQGAGAGQIQRKQNAGAQSTAGAGDAKARPGGAAGARPGGRGGRPPSLVVVQPVTDALINDRLKAVGNGRGAASVSVVPLSGGLLTRIEVSSGERVESGAVLATLDSEEEVIARDRAARTASDAAIDATRLEKLFRSRTSTEVELNRANAALADAELALREAELTLQRRTITAPIAGIVGLVSVDIGNYVTPQTELVTIDDRSVIVVEFWIPERFANQIAVGQRVRATALALPGDVHDGIISGISSRIEADSRTLKVQARIDNADDSLRPGMSFEVSMSFEGQRFPAIDPLAVQWDSDGSFVWKVVDDKAMRVPVRIVQRNPESVLVEAQLLMGDSLVTEGVLSMRQGASVRVQGSNSKPTARGSGESKPQAKPQAQKPQSEKPPAQNPDAAKPTRESSDTATQKTSEAGAITGKQQGS